MFNLKQIGVEWWPWFYGIAVMIYNATQPLCNRPQKWPDTKNDATIAAKSHPTDNYAVHIYLFLHVYLHIPLFKLNHILRVTPSVHPPFGIPCIQHKKLKVLWIKKNSNKLNNIFFRKYKAIEHTHKTSKYKDVYTKTKSKTIQGTIHILEKLK